MSGDERARFCAQCDRHVYNISELTGAEVRALVARTEGRFCARLYRRPDGTVLTKDCPAGLRAARRRVARAAGATLATLISLFSGVAGQTKSRKQDQDSAARGLRVERVASRAAVFTGRVLDPAEASIAGASVTLRNERTGERLTAATNEEGVFSFAAPAAGEYTFEVASPGFKTFKMKHLSLRANEAACVDLALQVRGGGEDVGVVVVDPDPPGSSGNGTTIFRSKEITSLPRG
jgi:hypothetical protein